MDEEQKIRLAFLKSEQKRKQHLKEICKFKSEICNEIPDFDKYFRFADDLEIAEINSFLRGIPTITSTRPDFDLLPYEKVLEFGNLGTMDSNVYLVFLCGSKAIFEVFVFGKISDIVKYYEDWDYFSAYIMFVFEDINRFIFIDDNGDIVESCLHS